MMRFDWTRQLYRLIYHPLEILARRTSLAYVERTSKLAKFMCQFGIRGISKGIYVNHK